MMYLKQAIRFQFYDAKGTLIAYAASIYGILAASVLINVLKIASFQPVGLEYVTCVFVFALGITQYRDTSRMLIANGRSRKTIFRSFLGFSLPVAAAVSILDTLNALAVNRIMGYQSLFVGLYRYGLQDCFASYYPDFFQGQGLKDFSLIQTTESPSLYVTLMGRIPSVILTSLLWSILLFTAIIMLGYVLSIIMSRLSRGWRITFYILLPAWWLVAFPLLEVTTTRFNISERILQYFRRIWQSDYNLAFEPMKSVALLALAVIMLILLIRLLLYRESSPRS